MNDFYEKNYQQYFESTFAIDSSTFLEPFAKFLKPLATILDIGCGSGRDLLWFAKKDFNPTGFEKAKGLADLAREHSRCPVIEGDVYSYDFSRHKFSALVFVGSLVHLSRQNFSCVLESTCQAILPGGLILITMKEGKGVSFAQDQDQDDRIFTLWSKKELELIFEKIGLKTLDFSRQVSKMRRSDIWMGFVLRLEK